MTKTAVSLTTKFANMQKLSVRYMPGFQKDLTSWDMTIDSVGKFRQTINVCRYNPLERYVEEYQGDIPSAILDELLIYTEALDVADITEFVNSVAMEDVEDIEIRIGEERFTAPLDWLLSRRKKGESFPKSVVTAIELWSRILPLSRYIARS
ncbi:hypothetical protein ACIPF8_24150 [Collimonas sp. NPDC087041]|uniref:hypothetical protein n=1 Tax=Collimonas sp. NPDC087041 TaxID=3363960 RepID=UPI00380EBB2C